MRLWSINPKYLDAKGLVALWRESLLAKKVLEGQTKGYKNHPQLYRFLNTKNELEEINHFLYVVYQEAQVRNYKFNISKIDIIDKDIIKIPVNTMQVAYEFELLKSKLIKRDVVKYSKIKNITTIELNPVFYSVVGDIEKWEKIIPEVQENIKSSFSQ